MLFIASDHVGIQLKKRLLDLLKGRGMAYQDLGTTDDTRVDYPIYAKILCEKVRKTKGAKGILICGTGIGMSMMANKIKNIRAAVCTNEYMAQMAVHHNDANVLCLGARVIGEELARSIVEKFLDSSFEGGGHKKRVKMFEGKR